MKIIEKSTPIHKGSGPLFQTPILSPDEKTFIRSPYQIPKMRRLSYLMEPELIVDENYNYHASNKLFQRQKNSEKENEINMTNKILSLCHKSATNPNLYLNKSTSSENEEFCSENQAFFNEELNRSKSDEFSIASMPAKLENFNRNDSNNQRNFESLLNLEKTEQNGQIDDLNSPIRIEKTLESSFRNDISEVNDKSQVNSSKYTQKDHALHELQLKDAIHRQNLSKMRKFIEELKQEVDEQKMKNESLLKQREMDAAYIMKTNKELQNYEMVMKKLKKENKEVKKRNIELELVLKEILFEKEYRKNLTPQKVNQKNNKPLQNITNCLKNQNNVNK